MVKLFTETRSGHALVDLLKANRDQLESDRSVAERIHTAPICTMCRTDLFFHTGKKRACTEKLDGSMAVVGRK